MSVAAIPFVARQLVSAFGGAVVHRLNQKPARDLNKEEAWILFCALVAQGEISVLQALDQKVTNHKISTNMAGVTYLHAIGKNSGIFGSVGAYKDAYFTPTHAFAIVLYRLAVRLKAKWGASAIVWGGIGAGSGKNESDCHKSGHCIDFYGASTSRGGFIDVRRDWYSRVVYTADKKPHDTAENEWLTDRWGNDRQTTYRLLVNMDAEARIPGTKGYFNFQARDFFLDLLQFIEDECAFSPKETSAQALRNGAKFHPGFTMHPDYPNFMRRPHNDHVHFQLGEAIHKK